MAGAAKLVFVELVARTQKFNQSLKKADAQVKKTTVKMAALGTALSTALVLGLRKASREFDMFASKGDDLAKLARGLRLNVNELQELQFVLERTGGAGSSVRNMMLAMDKALGDAAGGSKEYVDSFKALNLDFKELIKLDPAERFWEIRRAVQASKGDVEASAGAQIILGRGFKANVASMAETEKNITSVREEYKKLGGVSQETADLAESVKDLETNWQVLKDSFKSKAFEKIAPTVIEVRKSVEAFSVSLKEAGLLDGVVTAALSAIAAGFTAMAVAALAFTIAAFPVVGIVAAITLGVAGAAAGFATLITHGQELGQALKLVFNDIVGFAKSLGGSLFAGLFGGGAPKIEVPDTIAGAIGQTAAPLGSGVGLKSLRGRDGAGGPAKIQNFYQISGPTAAQMQSQVRRDNAAQLRTNKRGD